MVSQLNCNNPATLFSTQAATIRRKTTHQSQQTNGDQTLFSCSKSTQPQFGCNQTAQPKFGGWGRTLATGSLGALAAASAAVCLPVAAVTALAGCLIPVIGHAILLPIAAIIGSIPLVLGGMAMLVGSGGKSEQAKKD
jgi:hypothetical protein